MRLYGRIWRGLGSVVLVLAVGLAVLEWSALGVLIILGLLVPLCWVIAYLVPDQVLTLLRLGSRRQLLPRAMTGALAFLAVWSFIRISPALGLLAVLVALVTSPLVVERALHSARRPTAHVGLTGLADVGPLEGLDDQQLCRVWRESFWSLSGSTPPETVLRIVALREACLDELERRHGAAVHAWLDSDDPASGGPEKYLGEL